MPCETCGYVHPKETDCRVALSNLLQQLFPRGKLIQKSYKVGIHNIIVRDYSNSFFGKIAYKHSLPFFSTIVSSAWGAHPAITAHRAVRLAFISRYNWEN